MRSTHLQIDFAAPWATPTSRILAAPSGLDGEVGVIPGVTPPSKILLAPSGLVMCVLQTILFLTMMVGCCGVDVCDGKWRDDPIVAATGGRLAECVEGCHACGFAVEDSEEENAMCRPDGTIVVYSGMMKLFESDDELAAVLAHEMGHLIAGHTGKATPKKEIEADEIGVGVMVKAGYNPTAAARFWERYYERIGWWEGDGSHQEPRERVEMLKRLAVR